MLCTPDRMQTHISFSASTVTPAVTGRPVCSPWQMTRENFLLDYPTSYIRCVSSRTGLNLHQCQAALAGHTTNSFWVAPVNSLERKRHPNHSAAESHDTSDPNPSNATMDESQINLQFHILPHRLLLFFPPVIIQFLPRFS